MNPVFNPKNLSQKAKESIINDDFETINKKIFDPKYMEGLPLFLRDLYPNNFLGEIDLSSPRNCLVHNRLIEMNPFQVPILAIEFNVNYQTFASEYHTIYDLFSKDQDRFLGKFETDSYLGEYRLSRENPYIVCITLPKSDMTYQSDKTMYYLERLKYGPGLFGHYAMEDCIKDLIEFTENNKQNNFVVKIVIFCGGKYVFSKWYKYIQSIYNDYKNKLETLREAEINIKDVPNIYNNRDLDQVFNRLKNMYSSTKIDIKILSDNEGKRILSSELEHVVNKFNL